MKKNTWKRLLALSLSLALVLSATACGSPGKTDDNAADASKENDTSTAHKPEESRAADNAADDAADDASDAYKYGAVHDVRFTLGRTINANDEAGKELEASRAAQLLADAGNTIEYIDFTYDYTAIGAMFEGGQIPDTFEVANSEPQKLISNGWGRDITGCLEAAGINTADFNQGLLSIYTAPNGEIWGLPKYSYTMGILANAKLFRDAGLVNEDGSYMIPKTWDEVIEYGELINEKTGKGGFAMTAIDGMGGWYFTAMSLSFGADLCRRNDDGSYTSLLNSPESIEAMGFFRSCSGLRLCTAFPVLTPPATPRRSLRPAMLP